MKTLLTVALTVFNVVCGVNICPIWLANASSKPQEAAVFYGYDSSNSATFSDEQEACKFYFEDSTANAIGVNEACEFHYESYIDEK